MKDRKSIVQKVTSYARKKVPSEQFPVFRKFIDQYYAYAPLEDLEQRTPQDLYGIVHSHWELMQGRAPGEYRRKIFNPRLETDGWESSHTVLEFVLDDQPFLVDTLTTEINRRGFVVHFIIHLGGIKVIRNKKHQIIDVLSPDSHAKGSLIEAPIYIEIDKQTNPIVLEQLGQDLDRVINDARAVVSDWQKMESEIYFALEDIEKNKPPVSDEETEEVEAFLHWLLDHHFTFLGFRKYKKVTTHGKMALQLVCNSGLGVLRETAQTKSFRYYDDLQKEARKVALSNQIITCAQTRTRATVHGGRYTDYISVKIFDEAGEITGERWFIGLYTSSVYTDSPKVIPLIRLKNATILKRSGLPKNGHAYKALANIVETLPRDLLFQANIDELFEMSMGILQMQDRRCIRMFARKGLFGRFITCLVYVPSDDFTMELCYQMQEILQVSFSALEISYTTLFPDCLLARIHFTIRIDPKKNHQYDYKAIEQKLVEVGRSWRDDLRGRLVAQFGEEKGNELMGHYGRAFPTNYRENFSPIIATEDIVRMEALSSENGLAMRVYRPPNAPAEMIRFKLFHPEQTVPLSDAIPILEKMGLRVIGEHPYQLHFRDDRTIWINDFNMFYPKGSSIDLEEDQLIFQEAFKKIWTAEAEHDGFNMLVLGAHLNWKEVTILRAYAKYLKQIGFTFSQDYMEEILPNNAHIANLLVKLFLQKFNPSNLKNSEQKTQMRVLEDQIKQSLDKVANLDEDRILRMFLTLIQATVRTNYFQRDENGAQKIYLSFKFDPKGILDLPLPRPQHEIFVYAPHFEGVHLRTSNVARGGIRWSDRKEDFRFEILGLMKAQQVKNAVIVPSGAKGGFIPKLLPVDGNRDEIMKEGIRCYQDFISGLLDLTDNLHANKIIHPKDTICYDNDDPYFVVAADKGTATFSDIANSIAKKYDYWLGDAFASGGATGYDHKKIGITARGAWESVKRHFQELNIDIIHTPFTTIGIGDMAGDVFGNGVLLSQQMKLVAAFNGMHIFIDPDPDPLVSFKERERLFHLSRSTWEDYNPKLLSKGGAVYKRSEKSIKLSPEAMAILGTEKEQVTPNELIQTILRAPVDLFWNGGIGTFVKSAVESNLEARDRASDGIRVNANTLRCKVVGEGGNLGFTQLGRIEYELNGGQINTDFIDNSGGVDCSDHEVNIKILLNDLVIHSQMTEKQRNVLLAKMTNEVAQLVLRNNYRQARAIGIATTQSVTYIDLYLRYMKDCEREGKIDLKLEFLPDNEVLLMRKASGKGLTRPEIAVLMAYSKIILKLEIFKSDITSETYLNRYIQSAFPKTLGTPRFAKSMENHYLRGEIMVTQLSNLLITDMGITFAYQMHDETSASWADIVRAYVIAREVLGLEELWEIIESLDISAELQTEMTLHLVQLVRRSVRWLLRDMRSNLAVKSAVDLFSRNIKELNERLIHFLSIAEKTYFERKRNEWIAAGVPGNIATRIAMSRAMYSMWNVTKAAIESRSDIHNVANVYYKLADRLELDEFREMINDYPIETHWMLHARSAAKGDLAWQQRALTLGVLKFNKKHKLPIDSVDEWFEKNKRSVDRWLSVFTEMKANTSFEYSMLVVVIRELAELAQITGGLVH